MPLTILLTILNSPPIPPRHHTWALFFLELIVLLRQDFDARNLQPTPKTAHTRSIKKKRGFRAARVQNFAGSP